MTDFFMERVMWGVTGIFRKRNEEGEKGGQSLNGGREWM